TKGGIYGTSTQVGFNAGTGDAVLGYAQGTGMFGLAWAFNTQGTDSFCLGKYGYGSANTAKTGIATLGTDLYYNVPGG
ncbi:hypothetical protein ACI3PL_32640, partial [Lacticaseibacillus paracasei]